MPLALHRQKSQHIRFPRSGPPPPQRFISRDGVSLRRPALRVVHGTRHGTQPRPIEVRVRTTAASPSGYEPLPAKLTACNVGFPRAAGSACRIEQGADAARCVRFSSARRYHGPAGAFLLGGPMLGARSRADDVARAPSSNCDVCTWSELMTAMGGKGTSAEASRASPDRGEPCTGTKVQKHPRRSGMHLPVSPSRIGFQIHRQTRYILSRRS